VYIDTSYISVCVCVYTYMHICNTI